MLEAVNSSNRLSLIKSYHSRSNVQPCLCFRLLLLKEQVRSQCNVRSNCSTLFIPPLSPIDYMRFADCRNGISSPPGVRHEQRQALNLSAFRVSESRLYWSRRAINEAERKRDFEGKRGGERGDFQRVVSSLPLVPSAGILISSDRRWYRHLEKWFFDGTVENQIPFR